MVQIFSETKGNKIEYIHHQMDNPELDFETAKTVAKKLAAEKSPNSMILSWKNGKTGDFYPKRECGTENKPAWIYYAETRGADLIIDINEGEFVFMMVKI